MRVVDRLALREASWRSLTSSSRSCRVLVFAVHQPATFSAWASLYRGVCSDLMLAESFDLPRDTVAYLHALVARGHNALYRSRGFSFAIWRRVLRSCAEAVADPALRLSAAVFVVSFLVCAGSRCPWGLCGRGHRRCVCRADGPDVFRAHRQAREHGRGRDDAVMAGFYIQHNISIGLQCFAWGIVFGLGSLYQLLSNGIVLGTVFGHMAVSPHAANFFLVLASWCAMRGGLQES